MLAINNTVKEISGVGPDSIPWEILTSAEPLVLKDFAADWPLVAAGKQSMAAAIDYLNKFYAGATVGAFHAPPEAKGRVFYNDEMTGFNYQPAMLKLNQVLDEIIKFKDDDNAPMFYVGSTTVDTCLPGFRAENDIEFGDINPLASIWIGNRSRIAAHFDVPDNIACVAVGHRRFTLFPPDELPNLYVGPLDFTPAGQAISLVDFENPDFDRYPRFRAALKSALVAEMGPGDAIFIPSMWWHHVESLDSLNVLINYWWRRSPAYAGMPMIALNHALLAIRDLPEEQRRAWCGLFEHYVFGADDQVVEHIPEHCRGMLSPLDDMAARKIRAELLNKLNR